MPAPDALPAPGNLDARRQIVSRILGILARFFRYGLSPSKAPPDATAQVELLIGRELDSAVTSPESLPRDELCRCIVSLIVHLLDQ